MEQKSFILYMDYYEHVQLLNNEERGILLTAIFEYASNQVEIELSGMPKMAFSFIKKQMDRDYKKYQEKCDRNRENGSKGGRPKQLKSETDGLNEKPKETDGLFPKPKKPYNDTDTDTDTDNDTDNENENSTVNKKKRETKSICVNANERTRINYSEFVDKFHSVCTTLPKVLKLTDARKKKIKTFLEAFDTEQIDTILSKSSKSDFLQGKNSRGFTAGLDWIVNVSNATKILEGNYDNKKGHSKNRYDACGSREIDFKGLELELLGVKSNGKRE